MHRHANLEATATTYARDVLEITAADRCLSVAKLFFAYGLGNSLTFPLSVGATTVLNPSRSTPHRESLRCSRASDPRCSSPALDSAPPCSTPTCPPRPWPPCAWRSPPGRGAAGRAPSALQHDLRSTRARRHRFHRGPPHLRVQPAGRGTPGTSGRPVAGYDICLLDEDGGQIDEPDRPGFLHVRGELDRHGLLVPNRRPRGPRSRGMAAHRRRVRTDRGRRLPVPAAATTT